MFKTKTEISRMVEVYECICGHIMPKYTEAYGFFPAMPYFTFHSCCRECGAKRSEIKIVTGKWTWTYQVFKWWTFKPDKEILKVFSHSNYSLEKEIEELKKKRT